MLKLLNFLRRAGQVKRYHTELVLKEQNVGEHSFNVAWLCYLMTDGKPSAALLLGALAHDAAEHITGDIPSPTKRALSIRHVVQGHEEQLMTGVGLALPSMTAEEDAILKLADALDGFLYCVREISLGNRTLTTVVENYTAYVRELLSHTWASDVAAEILMYGIDKMQAVLRGVMV